MLHPLHRLEVAPRKARCVRTGTLETWRAHRKVVEVHDHAVLPSPVAPAPDPVERRLAVVDNAPVGIGLEIDLTNAAETSRPSPVRRGCQGSFCEIKLIRSQNRCAINCEQRSPVRKATDLYAAERGPASRQPQRFGGQQDSGCNKSIYTHAFQSALDPFGLVVGENRESIDRVRVSVEVEVLPWLDLDDEGAWRADDHHVNLVRSTSRVIDVIEVREDQPIVFTVGRKRSRDAGSRTAHTNRSSSR